jgi:hypothetical protein
MSKAFGEEFLKPTIQKGAETVNASGQNLTKTSHLAVQAQNGFQNMSASHPPGRGGPSKKLLTFFAHPVRFIMGLSIFDIEFRIGSGRKKA